MRREKAFKTIDKPPEQIEALKNELKEITARWNSNPVLQVRPDGYVGMIKLIKRIAYYLLRKQTQAQREVRKIMGGKVLPLPADRFIRLGEKRGEARGEKRGEARGEKRGESRMAKLMAILLGAGKNRDATEAATNPKRRQELYREYGIA